MKRKKESISSLKKIAWDLYSLIVRLTYADWRGYVKCCTCNDVRHYKDNMQAGHFIAGRGNSILFEKTNVHPQCYVCNIRKHGNQLEYYYFMKQKYGEKEIERLRRLSKESRSFTMTELREMIANFRHLLKELTIGIV